MIADPCRLELAGMSKVYPGDIALQAVCLAIRGGEVMGMIGENCRGQ